MLSNKDFSYMLASGSGGHHPHRFSLEEVAKMDRLNAKKFKRPNKSKPLPINENTSSEELPKYRDRAAERRAAEKLEELQPSPHLPPGLDSSSLQPSSKHIPSDDMEGDSPPKTELGQRIYALVHSSGKSNCHPNDVLRRQVYTFDIHPDNNNYIPAASIRSRLELQDEKESLTSYVSSSLLELLSDRINTTRPRVKSSSSFPLKEAPGQDTVGDIFEGLEKYVPDFECQSDGTERLTTEIFSHSHESIIESVKANAEVTSLKSIAPQLLHKLHDERDTGECKLIS